MNDVRYLENTIHVDVVDGLVYKTSRVVEEVYPRRGTVMLLIGAPCIEGEEVPRSVKIST